MNDTVKGSLAAQIRARLAEDTTHSSGEHVIRCAATYSQALTAVLDEHAPQRIYDTCGHTHIKGEPGTINVDEIGVVCEDGCQYTICRGCCCTEDLEQTGWCDDEHCRDVVPCWPCTTVRVVARVLGVGVPAVT